jgi:hypothetical protein
MGAGIPLAIHSHCSSRLLGTFDMAYEEAFVWRNPEELYNFIQCVDATMLEEQGRLSRKKYEDCYREEILQHALLEHAPLLQPPALHLGYRPDILQQALDISNQVNFVGAIKRLLYRNYRKWLR